MKDDVLGAIDESERQLRELADALRRSPEARLPDSEWSAREALCHVAARSNDVPMVVAMVERAQAPADAGSRPPSGGPDAQNAGQIAERTGRSVDDLLDEAYRGHAAARQAVQEMDEPVLARELPDFRGRGPVKLGDLIRMSYSRHLGSHLEGIRQAVSGP